MIDWHQALGGCTLKLASLALPIRERRELSNLLIIG